jgi:hypothetical protein
MSVASRLVGAVVVLGLASCSSIQTRTNYDPSAVQKIDGFHTYAWLPMKAGSDPNIYNPIIQERVHRAVDAQLQARGFQRVAPGQSPDFKVGWHGAVEQKVDVDTIDNYYGYLWDPWFDPFFGPVGYGGSGGVETQTREYREGTLILDVVDANSNKLVWRGTAQTELAKSTNASKSQKLIDRAAEKMLKDFPPQTGR